MIAEEYAKYRRNPNILWAKDKVTLAKPLRITFGCTLILPAGGRFTFHDQFEVDPQRFLKLWIEGALSTIYAGGPIVIDGLTGDIINGPKVAIAYKP